MLLLLAACGLQPYEYTPPDDALAGDTAAALFDTADETDPSDDPTLGDPDDTDVADDTDDPIDTGSSGGGSTPPPTGTSYPAGIGTGGSGGGTGLGSATVGAANYTWYVPACTLSTGIPMPVLFTAHGSGGTGAQMVDQWRPTADAECFAVFGMDSGSGSSWNFNTDVDAFNEMFMEAQMSWNLDTTRFFLHGYSAGAHWAYVIGLSNSDVFSGIAVYAGSLNTAEAYGVWPSGTGRAIPMSLGHGSADTVVPYASATHAETELGSAAWPVDLWTASGAGHEYRADSQSNAYHHLMANVP